MSQAEQVRRLPRFSSVHSRHAHCGVCSCRLPASFLCCSQLRRPPPPSVGGSVAVGLTTMAADGEENVAWRDWQLLQK